MTDVILDTNVFVSGIFWGGAPSLILEAWHAQKIELITSPDIIDEYTDKDLLDIGQYDKIKILSPSNFLKVHNLA